MATTVKSRIRELRELSWDLLAVSVTFVAVKLAVPSGTDSGIDRPTATGGLVMFLRKGSDDPRTLMTIGMSALLIASVGRWFLHPATPIGTDVADAIYGFLIGIAIAANLMSVRRSRGRA